MPRRKKPEVKCYHCDRDLQYELEAMRGALKRTIEQCHTYEKSNRRLEREVKDARDWARFYAKGASSVEMKGMALQDDPIWLERVDIIEAPEERYDQKPEEEE